MIIADRFASGSIRRTVHAYFSLLLLLVLGPVAWGTPRLPNLPSTVRESNLQTEDPENQATKLETITLGGGCFWCVEAVFQRLHGVKSVVSGYTGGTTPNPTYQTIKYGGHAEVVQVTFDPEIVSLEQVLIVFLKTHDPTSWYKQGPDIGPQYRSAIFYHSEDQRRTAESIIKKFTEEKVYRKPIVTEITKLTIFYRAEDYHQNYYNLNKDQTYCQTVVRDKVLKFERLFKEYSVTNKKREERKNRGKSKTDSNQPPK